MRKRRECLVTHNKKNIARKQKQTIIVCVVCLCAGGVLVRGVGAGEGHLFLISGLC
jgi:hypothetical protein